jgi:hypothetical protein
VHTQLIRQPVHVCMCVCACVFARAYAIIHHPAASAGRLPRPLRPQESKEANEFSVSDLEHLGEKIHVHNGHSLQERVLQVQLTQVALLSLRRMPLKEKGIRR